MPTLNLGGGKALDPETRARFEAAMNHDFSHVRIHTDGTAQARASEVNAHAFAVGNHIFFSSGAFQPGTPDGDRLIAHELTHVVQHDEHRVGRLPGDRDVSRPTDPTEVEAYANERRVSAELGKVDQALAEHEVSAPQPMLPGERIMDLVDAHAEEGMPTAVSDRMHAALGTGNNVGSDAVVSRSAEEEIEMGPGKHPGSEEEQALIVAEMEVNQLKRPIEIVRAKMDQLQKLMEGGAGNPTMGLGKVGLMGFMDVMSHHIELALEKAERDFAQLSQGETKEFPHQVEAIKTELTTAYEDLSIQFPDVWKFVAPDSQLLPNLLRSSGENAKFDLDVESTMDQGLQGVSQMSADFKKS